MSNNIDLSGWELVGRIGVDSGQMMLADPCYLDDFEGDFTSMGSAEKDEKGREVYKPTGTWDYDGACLASLSPAQAGLIGNGKGAVCSTGFGDGEYGVYVQKSNEGSWGTRVSAMMIVFIGDEEDEEDEAYTCGECGNEIGGFGGDLCDDCESERYCDCGEEKDSAHSQCEACDEADEEEAGS